MSQTINYPPIEHIEIRDGQARLNGRNLKVKMVISRLVYGEGASIDEVLEQYAAYNLTRAEVYACLAYYYDHQQAIDQYFVDSEGEVAKIAVNSGERLKHLHRHANELDTTQ